MADEEMTTLWVSKKNKEAFEQLGTMGTTQDELFGRLIDFYRRYKGVADRKR